MKANELMVSDYIIVTDDIARVVALFADGRISYICPDGTGGVTLGAKPIPLTAEILEKNGFECRGAWCLPGEDLGLRQDGDNWGLLSYYEEYDALAFCHIEYVHELQHTLRLCRIEKKIEL